MGDTIDLINVFDSYMNFKLYIFLKSLYQLGRFVYRTKKLKIALKKYVEKVTTWFSFR